MHAVSDTISDNLAVLNACERGEDAALDSYRDALAHDLPANVRGLIEQQCQGVRRNHDLVRQMRNAMKASADSHA